MPPPQAPHLEQGASFHSDPQRGPERAHCSGSTRQLSREDPRAQSTYRSHLRSQHFRQIWEAGDPRAPAAVCPQPSPSHSGQCRPGAAWGQGLVSLNPLWWGGIEGLGSDRLFLRTLLGHTYLPTLPESPLGQDVRKARGQDHLCRALNGPGVLGAQSKSVTATTAGPALVRPPLCAQSEHFARIN